MRLSQPRAVFAACLLFAGASAAYADMFEPLFTATRVVGPVQVVRPGRSPEPMRPDHSYPYGTRILVPDEVTMTNGVPAAPCEAAIDLARDYRFRLGRGTDVTIRDMSVGDADDRTEIKLFELARGTVNTYITANTQKTGSGLGDAQVDKNLAAIVVRTPMAECTRLSQRNEIRVVPGGAGGHCSAVFTTQSGTMEINGPQFSVRDMKRNASVMVSGDPGDQGQSAISTVNGEFVVAFEKGADAEERVRFKARYVGKIRRERAAVGGRLAVAVMVYYPHGNAYEMKSYIYLEGQTNVGMWTSVAAAVSGEHSALAVAEELASSTGGGSSGEEEWNPDAEGDGGDDGGWNPDESDGDDGGFGDGGFDDDGFEFGF